MIPVKTETEQQQRMETSAAPIMRGREWEAKEKEMGESKKIERSGKLKKRGKVGEGRGKY